ALDQLNHVTTPDVVHGAATPLRQDQPAERVLSLRPGAQPPLGVPLDEQRSLRRNAVGLGALGRLGGSSASIAPVRCRVDTLLDQVTCLGDEPARLGEADVICAAEGVFAAHAVEGIAMRPTLGAARLNNKVEAERTTVRYLAARRLRLGGLDRQRGEYLCSHEATAPGVTGVTGPSQSGLAGRVRVCSGHLRTNVDKVNGGRGFYAHLRRKVVRVFP